MALNRVRRTEREAFGMRTDPGSMVFAEPQLGRARLKACNDDFKVDELLPFEPRGEGAHVLLLIRQDGWNTAAAARWLARAAGCPVRDVGYCGHKDRHAVTEQYFSVPSREKEGDFTAEIEWPEGLSLVRATRHDRKLRRGIHRGNRFMIRLREVEAPRRPVDEALGRIARLGFPNYFGEQRFGRDKGNVDRARERLASGKFRASRNAVESIEISALRSMLFNELLASRVRDETWLVPLEGDLMILDGTRSFFEAPAERQREEDLEARVLNGDLHVSGPLWGAPGARFPTSLMARERQVLAAFLPDLDMLEANGFSMDRRPLRAAARELSWNWAEEHTLDISFSLARGSYATVLLSALFDLNEGVAA